jgi:tetratricopeptide (TPR) repeat protein
VDHRGEADAVQPAEKAREAQPADEPGAVLSAEQAEWPVPGGAAQAVLELAALLDGRAIPAEIFSTPAARGYLAGEAGAEPVAAGCARAALADAAETGLLTTGPAGPPDLAASIGPAEPAEPAEPAALVRMSAPAQAAVLARMPEGALEQAVPAAAGALLESWPGDDRGRWQAGVLRSCAASLQRAAGDLLWTGGCHPLLMRAGQSLDSAGLTGPAVEYWTELADVSWRVLGRGHPDTLTASERLAEAYLAAGQAEQAIWCCEAVLAELVRVLGPDHPSAIAARRNLGRALMAANRFGDAVTVLDRVAGDYERVRGAGHADTLAAQEELAAAHLGAGRTGDAIRWYRKTLADRERVQGPENPDVMSTRQKLGDAYKAAGDLKNALSAYKRALADRERVLGPDHLDTIAVRGNLGAAYHSAGRMASALQFYEQTRAGYEKALGPDHPETLARSAKLAHAYYSVGRVTDGLMLLRDTLARCERSLPPGDPLTEAVRESLTKVTG